jgi:putative DNA primase/helicase
VLHMIAPHIIDQARAVRIEEECERRGIALRGAIDRCGPCPKCGGTDRFAINIRKQVFLCRGCGVAGDVIRLVQHVDDCSFVEAVEVLMGDHILVQAAPPASKKKKQSAEEYAREQHRKARSLWARRKPIGGSIAEHYLREIRKITCRLPPTLGFLPGRRGQHPAMIAAYGLVDEPEPGVVGIPRNLNAVHLTLLRPDGGGKADIELNKLTLSSPQGHPIASAPPNNLLGLAITEGIEDALTVHQVTGLGAWAAGSASFMPKLANAVPTYIDSVTIYGHDDGGKRFALELAKALHLRGFEVRVEGLSP